MSVVGDVNGLTQLHDTVYIVCQVSSTILRFNSTTYQRLTDISVKDLKSPYDIVACQLASQLYVCDYQLCIWRVAEDGEDVKRWLPKSPSDTFKPYTLSVTSARLLVTSYDTHQLTQFDADGIELRCVQLPDDIRPLHAVESPTGTFVISQYNKQLKEHQLIEVNTAGEQLRQFSRPLFTAHIAVDCHGKVLVSERDNRILMLDNHLSLRRVIIDEHQLNYEQPLRLCYMAQSGQLLVGLVGGHVAVFDVLRR